MTNKPAVKGPNNPNTRANLYAPKAQSNSAKSVQLRQYLTAYLKNHSTLSFTLAQLTLDVNTDLKRNMTESGVTRALMNMGISLKESKLDAIEKVVKKVKTRGNPITLNDALAALADKGFYRVSHTFVGEVIANRL